MLPDVGQWIWLSPLLESGTAAFGTGLPGRVWGWTAAAWDAAGWNERWTVLGQCGRTCCPAPLSYFVLVTFEALSPPRP